MKHIIEIAKIALFVLAVLVFFASIFSLVGWAMNSIQEGHYTYCMSKINNNVKCYEDSLK